MLDFDKGAYRAKNRKDTVEIESWADVADMTREDLDPYKTIVVDTVGRCLDSITTQIIEENPKNARGSGDLTLQGYGVLKGKFISWLKLMRSYGKDVLLISHMDEKTEGDIVKERLDVQGGSKTEIYKSADAIAKLYIDGKFRKLDFSPREGSLGKNPGQFEILAVPDFRKEPLFLAGVLKGIKSSINQLSAEQQKETEIIETWRQLLAMLKTPQEFNGILPKAKVASEVVKAMVMAESKRAGLTFDKASGEFKAVDVPQKAESPSQGKPEAKKGVVSHTQNIVLQKARKASGIVDADYYAVLNAIAGVDHGPDVPKEHFDAVLKEVANWQPDTTGAEQQLSLDRE